MNFIEQFEQATPVHVQTYSKEPKKKDNMKISICINGKLDDEEEANQSILNHCLRISRIILSIHTSKREISYTINKSNSTG